MPAGAAANRRPRIEWRISVPRGSRAKPGGHRKWSADRVLGRADRVGPCARSQSTGISDFSALDSYELAECVSVIAGRELLRNPEPQLLRLLRSGSVEDHAEAYLQLWCEVGFRERSLETDQSRLQGRAAACGASLFTKSPYRDSRRIRIVRRPL